MRIRDNRDVFIKRVSKSSTEGDIIVYLSRPALRAKSSNHTVPLLDFIKGNDEYDFIVMPLLRFFDDPPFVFVDEALDFIRQSLKVGFFLIFLRSAALTPFEGIGILTSGRSGA